MVTSVADASVMQSSRSVKGILTAEAAISTVARTASEAFSLHDAKPHFGADNIWGVQDVRFSPWNARREDKADVA